MSTDPVVTIEAPKAPVEPGETCAVVVRVLNRGTTVESYRIDVVGPARAWSTPPGEPLALFPDSMGEASVRFTPPAQSGPRAGTVRVGIRVAAVSSPHDAKVEEFDLSIATVVLVTAKLAPPNSRGWRKGRHRIELFNAGNVDTPVFVDAKDPDEQLRCHLSQEAVVPAGDAIIVPLVVIPPKGKIVGKPVAYPFEVEVFPTAGQAVALRGSVRQRPLLAPPVLVAAALVLAVVVGVTLLGRADPTSSATDRSPNTVGARDLSLSTSASTSGSEAPTTTTSTVPVIVTTTSSPTTTATLPPAQPGQTPSQPGGQPRTQGNPQTPVATTVPVAATPTTVPALPATPVVTAAPPVSVAATAAPIPPVTPFRIGPTYAGDGVIYAVTTSGNLLFYQDLRQNGTSNGTTGEGWAPTGSQQVGCGFASFQHLIGAEGGMIYAVDAAGEFLWYKDLARNGTNDACHGGGYWAGGGVMGTGWSGYKQIFYGGDGIIYAIDSAGNLRFCQDVGLDGTFDTPVCPVIATGWGDYRQVFASGAPGVIYAITQTGDLLFFRDTLRNGTNASNGGWIGPSTVGNGWQTMYAVFGGAINSSAYPNGVIYSVASNFDLQWRQDTLQDGSNGRGGSVGWLGYSTIGTGFQNFI